MTVDDTPKGGGPRLYPYQQEGVDWLVTRRRALLADDPGLGKTPMAARAAAAVGAKRVLVLAPACVLYNWRNEIQQWTTMQRVQVMRASAEQLDDDAQVTVVSHGMFWRSSLLRRIKDVAWDVIIVDESHCFRSRTAKRARALYEELVPSADRVWLLTGTPMPNDASELWTMARGFEWTDKSFFAWRDRYCKTQWHPFGDNVKVVGNKNVGELVGLLRPGMMRRRKDDELDLPPVRYQTVALTPGKMPHEIAEVRDQLDPELVAQLENVGTADEAFEELGASKAFAAYRRLCGLAKASAVADLLEIELEGGLDKIVVMAHHKDVVDAIAKRLHHFGVAKITGATPAAERTEIVGRFQYGRDVRVIVGNIVAAGVGLTLTAAAELLFAELSFVPGENRQAADRIIRIGQQRTCRIRSATLAGTLDEAIVGVLNRKTQMISEVIR